MTMITGKEPAHWHTTRPDGTVRHAMTDPRTTGIAAIHWSPDEKLYVAHLDEHERLKVSLQPRDNDLDAVRTLVLYIQSEEKRIADLRELAINIREEIDSGVTPEESQWLKALNEIWPRAAETETT